MPNRNRPDPEIARVQRDEGTRDVRLLVYPNEVRPVEHPNRSFAYRETHRPSAGTADDVWDDGKELSGGGIDFHHGRLRGPPWPWFRAMSGGEQDPHSEQARQRAC